MAVSLMLVLSVLGAARARPEMRAPNGAVATRAPVPKPAFSFAPVGGQNMGTACACANPTGSKGEAIVFSRGTAGFCNKHGLSATSISNGDLVSCPANKARVMPGVANGPLGIVMEPTRINATIRSQEFDHATWVDSKSGAGSTVVTPNAAVAPDGTSTAERLQIPQTTAAQYSGLYHAASCSVGANIVSLYVKGVSTSGNTRICAYNGAVWEGATCSFVSDSWSRCSMAVTVTGAASALQIGNSSLTSVCGESTSTMPAVDVYMWGAQCELGDYATSYIPTEGGAVQRDIDIMYVSAAATTLTKVAPISMSAKVGPLWSAPPALTSGLFNATDVYGGTDTVAFLDSSNFYFQESDIGSYTAQAVQIPFAGAWVYAANNQVVFQQYGKIAVSKDSTTQADTLSAVEFGIYNGNRAIGGVIYDVCIDPNYLRCR